MNLNQQLDYLFDPRSVAVIGASKTLGKWGSDIFKVLLSKGGREIYPINQKEAEVLGVRAYSNIVDVPGPVDLAVIAVPFEYVLGAIRDCVQKGVKAAVIVSGGLAETGEEGAKIEREVVAVARKGGLRFVGPNCMGFLSSHSNITTTRAKFPVKQGSVAVVSQSGNSATAILDLASQMGLGISKWVSSGNEADLHFEDYLEYLAQDEKTKVILGYVEGFREGRRFWELAKKITRKKPIVIMKAGRTDAGAKAARSHSAALAGSDLVYQAAFKQSGVIRVEDINELVDVALALLGQPLPRGRRVGVLSMGGGFAVIIADAIRKHGLELPSLSATTMEKLNTLLSGRWSHGNPVDPGGDMITYPCLWPILADENIDAMIVSADFGTARLRRKSARTGSSAMDDQAAKLQRAAEEQALKDIDTAIELMKKYQRPLIFASMFPMVSEDEEVYKKLKQNHLTPHTTPERAVRALARLVEYSEYLRTSGEG